MSVVLATGLLYSFQQADLQGKIIVLILCFGSAVTWSVMLTKWQQLRRTNASCERFLAQFRRDRDPLHLYINNFEMDDCPLFNIYQMGAEEVSGRFGESSRPSTSSKSKGLYNSFDDNGGGVAVAESEVGVMDQRVVKLDMLRGALGRAIDAEVMKLESQISLLSTAVTGGPFLGLLGSAWGIMSVFAQMGVYGTVRLGAVAPGISAALLATVVGLLVAVPCLFGYNWLATRIRHATIEMEGFADEFVTGVERNYSTD